VRHWSLSRKRKGKSLLSERRRRRTLAAQCMHEIVDGCFDEIDLYKKAGDRHHFE
jgi:hypothetical protein